MIGSPGVIELHELDLVADEAQRDDVRQRRRKLGLGELDLEAIERQRAKVVGAQERRWLVPYERARQRYGRGMATVRDRVCSGCFVTLPRTAAPADSPGLGHCESCGRLLYWG